MIKFSDKAYQILKWLCLIFSPALITFISAIGRLYNFDTTVINGLIASVTAFVGALIGISNKNYYSQEGDKTE